MSIYPYLANRLIFPIGDRIRGTNVTKYLSQLEEKQWWAPERVRIERDDKLTKLIKHCYENVPYWTELFNRLKLKVADIKTKDDLFKLPILTKDAIRKNLQSMLAKNFPLSRFIEQHSSGSTGEPLRYYADKEHYSWRLASMFRFWKWAGYEFGMRWARLSLWPHNRISEKISDKFARCLYVRVFGIDEAGLDKDIQRLSEYKPEIIRGYASATYLLAKHARDHGIDNIRPKAVITTGDMLFPHYRGLIEEQFHCRVYDTYGGEGISVSGQCNKGNYHIDDNNVIVEFIKDDGRAVRAGELANIILTDLNNFAMPFIRYKIQDVGKPGSGLCSCGRGLSTMESIEGRDSDIIRTPDNKHLIVHFFTAIFEFLDGVEQFQVVQTKLDEIVIKIVKNEKFNQKDIEHIENIIKQGGGEKLKVRFDFVSDISLERSGKRRFVISKLGLQ